MSRILRDAKVLIGDNPDWYIILAVSEPPLLNHNFDPHARCVFGGVSG